MSENKKFKTLITEYIIPKKIHVLALLILILVGTSITGISPYLYGKMLDAITIGNLESLKILIMIYLFVNIVSNFLSILENYIGKITNFSITSDMQKSLFNSIVGMTTQAYNSYETGELLSRLNGDSDSIVGFTLNFVTSIVNIIVNLVISVYFVIKISLFLSTISLFYVPSSILLTYMIRKHYRKLSEKQKEFSDEFYSFQSEVFVNNMGIKSFNLQKKMNDKYGGFICRQYDMLRKSIKLSSINQFASNMIMMVSSLFIIYLSAVFINKGLLSIGLMVAFGTYINKFFAAVSQILGLNISLQSVMVSVNRIYDMLTEDVEESLEKNFNKEIISSELSIQNISFTYPSTNEIVLKNITFDLTENGFYSFVGPNGCGKSTLSKLLTRLYDPQMGSIHFCCHDMRDFTYTELRSRITYIQKEEFFLNDTILNNLKIGNETISDEEIIKCCKRVGVDVFVENLPEKYLSPMGEAGLKFSSGQKQKISIVRAILRKSQVYIFDELTANLDGDSEKDIIRILHEISKNAIVIFISHSTTSIKDSKCIYLIDKGKIIDSGTHFYLIDNNMLYKKLFRENSLCIEPTVNI